MYSSIAFQKKELVPLDTVKHFINERLDTAGSAVAVQPKESRCEKLMGGRVSRATTVFAYNVTKHACPDEI